MLKDRISASGIQSSLRKRSQYNPLRIVLGQTSLVPNLKPSKPMTQSCLGDNWTGYTRDT